MLFACCGLKMALTWPHDLIWIHVVCFKLQIFWPRFHRPFTGHHPKNQSSYFTKNFVRYLKWFGFPEPYNKAIVGGGEVFPYISRIHTYSLYRWNEDSSIWCTDSFHRGLYLSNFSMWTMWATPAWSGTSVGDARRTHCNVPLLLFLFVKQGS